MKDLMTAAEMLTKDDVTTLILLTKSAKEMKWEAIAEAIGLSPVFTHSACMGMNAMPGDKAAALVPLLDLPAEA